MKARAGDGGLRAVAQGYVTWVRWSDDFVGLVAPVLYSAEKRGFAAGVQIETWVRRNR